MSSTEAKRPGIMFGRTGGLISFSVRVRCQVLRLTMAYCCFVFAVFGRGTKHETHACICYSMIQYVYYSFFAALFQIVVPQFHEASSQKIGTLTQKRQWRHIVPQLGGAASQDPKRCNAEPGGDGRAHRSKPCCRGAGQRTWDVLKTVCNAPDSKCPNDIQMISDDAIRTGINSSHKDMQHVEVPQWKSCRSNIEIIWNNINFEF